ncbi:hypothetical protein [Caldiplasma sukawensis]
MSLEDILKDISDKAEEEVKRIRRECEEDLKNIEKDKEAQLQAINEKYRHIRIDTENMMRKRYEDELRIEQNNIKMQYENRILEEFWKRANNIVLKIRESKSYEDIIRKELSLGKKFLKKSMKVKCSEKDVDIVKKIDETVEIMKMPGDFAGIICESGDGKISYDMTINSILRDLKESINMEILKMMVS